MISGFARSGLLSLARWAFDEMPLQNMVSWNAMIPAYTQSGNMNSAHRLFKEMPERDVVSWTTMISGYVQNNRFKDALFLFNKMQLDKDVKPNEITLVTMLSPCAHLAALNQGRWIHTYMERNNIVICNNLGAALVDMYTMREH
ncbi:hypothetical protein AMTRI_Chr10g8510 [Amborella trichopoda]